VLGAAIGALTVNFLNTGLVFYALQVHFVQLFTSVLLVIVIVFQTMSRVFDARQSRKSLLAIIDERKTSLLEKKKSILGK
jgi:ribose/xylose/arabinose/galactoside ABC-type transport system permease subunit